MRTTNSFFSLWALALCLLSGPILRADEPTPPKPSGDSRAAIAASLQWQTGTITLKDGLAKINLSDDFRFLDHANAEKVLHDLWGNPPDPDELGMIFPAAVGPLDPGRWGIAISYEEGGYVKDDDAEKINYNDLLKKMQQEVHDSNAERQKEGYHTMELTGWAAPPRYDKATHKLYWAKELQVGDFPEHTLNYDIRVLGRRGVLVLNAISSMDEFPAIQEKMPAVLAMVDFQPGNAYADFNPKIDKVAEYGLATLVAGGALAGAAKLGLFGFLVKYFLVVFLALKKGAIVLIIALAAGVKKLWSKFTGKSSTPDHLLPPPGSGPAPPTS
jgi:uncharacterized membrane-anchored protein